MSFAEKADKARTGGVDADPVIEPLLKILAEGQATESREEMQAHMNSDKVNKFVPHGTKIDSFTVNGSDNKVESYDIFHASDSDAGFREYHSKLQPWIMFFIDAASYIDVDDANWRFFLAYVVYLFQMLFMSLSPVSFPVLKSIKILRMEAPDTQSQDTPQCTSFTFILPI